METDLHAYSRPGGAAPLCYPSDVTAAMIEKCRITPFKDQPAFNQSWFIWNWASGARCWLAGQP
jgi:hypothetical protein